MKTKRTKHNEAIIRQVKRDKLTDKQQLAILSKRPGNSKREIARLQ